ncbi:MAG: hypothetical protein ABSH09_27925 [Bryobacteraceae bacterium]
MRRGVLAALCLCGAAFAQPAQINVSHDLVQLGIASQNVTPNTPALDARPLFQAALAFAQQNNVPLVTADQGSYYFLTPQMPDRYLNLDKVSNLTIDLQGSDVYIQNSYLMWLCVIDSRHVTLQNFTVDSLNLPFTQVQITSVASAQSALNYRTIPGWPSPTSFNNLTAPDGSALQLWALVFRNGSLIPGTNRLPISTPLQPGVLNVTLQDSPWTQPSVLAAYQPGDTVVFTARGGEAPILITGGDSNVVGNVDVYSSGSIGVHLDTLSNSRMENVRVLPRPGTDRLISTNADGLHLSFTLANNSIRNCFVSRTMDDGIAINSPFLAFVNQQSGNGQVTVERNFDAIFPNGLPVLFVNPATAATLSGTQILSQNPRYTDPPATQTATLSFTPNPGALQNGFGMIYASASNRGNGSVIENNVVEDVFSARGIYLGGVIGVTVQHNTIRRTNCGAIVGHEDVASYPVGPNQNIRILNNTIEGAIGPAAVGTGAVAAIASIFFLSTDRNFDFVSTTPNGNITIANNYIADSGRGAIWISNVNGGSVTGNTIAGFNLHPELALWGVSSQAAAELTQDFTQAIVVHSSAGVTVEKNDSVGPIVPVQRLAEAPSSRKSR